MKPYGRLKTIKFPSKIDNHIRKNNKKIKNWWEGDCENIMPRATIKQIVKREWQDES